MSFYDEDAQCPKCAATKLRDPNLTLVVNICGHPLCKSCVENMFVRGSAACYECGLPLKRTDFKLRLFDDAYVEKELRIRQKVIKDFNKHEDDFDSLEEYNDYLETIETIIYNLANNIDVKETNEKIEKYRRENKDSIKRNKFKKSKEQAELDAIVDEENERNQQLKKASNDERLAEKRRLQNDREALIEELISSSATADEIIESHLVVKAHKLAASVTTAELEAAAAKRKAAEALSVSAVELIAAAKARPRIESTGLPAILDKRELEAIADYRSSLRPSNEFEKAGGFSMSTAARRILNEAFNGLFFTASV